jgi:hypothetical protein
MMSIHTNEPNPSQPDNSKNVIEYDAGKFINLEEVGNRRYHYNYTNYGFNEAGRAEGSVTAFKLFLSKLYHRYTEYARQHQAEFHKEKTEIESKISEFRVKNQNIENRIKDMEIGSLKEIEEKIKDLKQEIHSIKENPEKLRNVKTSKLGFYIGVLILAALSVYLWIFYSSAIYSAFFREIDSTTNLKNILFNSVFYPNAISDAFSRGITALMFTSFSPVLFLALGYLIYKFGETKERLKMIAIVSTTFIFDCIIAYEISNKIYDVKAQNTFANMAPYELINAIKDVNFYAIIFLGFLAYIIWGIVLSFAMEEYGKLNVVTSALTKLKNQIKELELERTELKEKITSFKNEASENELQICKLENSLKSFFFNLREFNKIIFDFSGGWVNYLVNGKHPHEKCEQVHEITTVFLSTLQKDFAEVSPAS